MTDVLIVGAGQAGLATGYFLKRTGLSFELVDAQAGAGGAWRHGWESLRLFSPAGWSSLPGWPMPPAADGYPTRAQVLAYLEAYERRYALPVRRPVRVESIEAADGGLLAQTDSGRIHARALVSATGTWSAPFIPAYAGRESFRGLQLHSADYRSPHVFSGQRVLVVGGGNSGAQILAEVSEVARATWVTLEEPVFLPDDVDGRVLFERASARFRASQAGLQDPAPAGGLGDIVMVPSVRRARNRGALGTRRPFVEMTMHGVRWADGSETRFDAVIWCTGFRPALAHLASLGIIEPDGRVAVDGTRSVRCPNLWLVGYGDWTGFASATLVGVMRSARASVHQIERVLD